MAELIVRIRHRTQVAWIKQYIYNMSSGVGVSNLNGNPYQVQLGLRYAF